MTIYTSQVGGKTNRPGGLMNFQLSLTEYSAKYKVSISTLRRRIKKGELSFIQEAGKYILPDLPFDELLGDNIVPPTHIMADRGFNNAPPQESTHYTAAAPFLEPLGMDLSFEPTEEVTRVTPVTSQINQISQTSQPQQRSEELVELKKAYTLVLGEKEEQIIQLKQHIVDLQTLNKALDTEVDRLKDIGSTGLKTSFIKHRF